MTQILHSPANWSRQTVKTVKYVFWRGESDEVSCIFLTAIVLFPDQLWNYWQVETLYFNMRTYNYPPHPPTHTHTRMPWKIPNTFPHAPGNRGFSDGKWERHACLEKFGMDVPYRMCKARQVWAFLAVRGKGRQLRVCALDPALNWCQWKNKANQSKTTEI